MGNPMSRTDFMKYTAASGAAMLLSSLELFASDLGTSKIKVALIGCGSVSNRYIPHLQSSSLIEIVALCDLKYERALEQKKQYNLQIIYL